MATLPDYAELHCRSAFSFGLGASLPEELVARAAALGYAALALTDEATVAGMVRAHQEAQACGLRLLPGAEFALPPAPEAVASTAARARLVALARDADGWAGLCEFITRARGRAPKGQYRLAPLDAREPDWALLRGCEIILVLPGALDDAAAAPLWDWAYLCFAGQLWCGVPQPLGPHDDRALARAHALAQRRGVPALAVGSVMLHSRARKPLHDVLGAVRCGQPLRDCALALQANAETCLRPRDQLAARYPPELLANTLALAQRCHFSLDALRYQYPLDAVLPGCTPAQTLQRHTHAGAQRRYPQGVAAAVRQQLAHELALIAELRYEMYFLTVYDLVAFARSRGILCQGRGSAANSAVCYCLGITEIDPARSQLLFERFISRERAEPPDIDVDFEHQRREEVIQYLYARYGRDRAALTAVAIRYRPRSALRAVGLALGVPQPLIDAMAREHPGMGSATVLAQRLSAALQRLGPDVAVPAQATLARWLTLSQQLLGLPRHLSQHPGGFVITRGPLTRLVPVEPAAMPGRSVIQWDKDDLDALGLLKVDVLALGMLSALHRCLDRVSARRGRPFALQDIPADDPATFDMLCAADTVGVFQIESRAQMSMLPRLKPRCFYDLVVEVAIVRPGPIQGGMVHPYLAARANPQAVRYPSEDLRAVLQRTLGVPIFQEQVMQVAMAAADYSPGEADQLRRAMAAWKRKGGLQPHYERLVGGMLRKGYSAEFAEQLFHQIEGFGEYGFPESHAASFALLVWASAWLKRHEPACFLAALLDSQPMGFYAPAQLVQDAQRHGVPVLPVDVSESDWDCRIVEPGPNAPAGQSPAVRLGLRLVGSLAQAAAQRLVQARAHGPWIDVNDLARRAGLDRAALDALARADALQSLCGHRRQQVWQARAVQAPPPLLRDAPVPEAALTLACASQAEAVRLDYAALGLSLRAHPIHILRDQLSKMKYLQAVQLRACGPDQRVRVCGLVTLRQSPGTAKGVTFVTLEDETGHVNVIVWKALRERQRDQLLHARLMAVHGHWQCAPGSTAGHVIAGFLRDLTPLLDGLVSASRAFH
ncbi:MAG: error-prone DNA polymerase [Rhodoferax sp.]